MIKDRPACISNIFEFEHIEGMFIFILFEQVLDMHIILCKSRSLAAFKLEREVVIFDIWEKSGLFDFVNHVFYKILLTFSKLHVFP